MSVISPDGNLIFHKLDGPILSLVINLNLKIPKSFSGVLLRFNSSESRPLYVTEISQDTSLIFL